MRHRPDKSSASQGGQTADPNNENAHQARFKRRERPVKEFNKITHDRNGDGEVRDDKRNAVAEIRQKAPRLSEGIRGVTAHAARTTAEHPALRKHIGNR